MKNAPDSDPLIIILMGVSGSGKTTVGTRLAAELGWTFYEGDDFHPPANVAKMATSMALTDEDRQPWLARLSNLIDSCLQQGRSAVITCSALKESYREQLRRENQRVQFVYLKGEYDTIFHRMASRRDHYMKPGMLRSQYDALEPPTGDEAIIIGVENDVKTIVEKIREAVRTCTS